MRINAIQRARLFKLSIGLMLFAIAIAIILNALKQNINLYLTPSDIKTKQAVLQNQTRFRLGGLVMAGSHIQKESLAHEFDLTDGQSNIHVYFKGLLPDLFREKQGIVTQGYLNEKNEFIAEQVLAKHDENYHPPDIPKNIT